MKETQNEKERLERQRAAVIHCLYWLMILVGIYLAMKYLLPVLMPFVLAYLIAWVLDRPIDWLKRKLRLPRAASAAICILLFAALSSGAITLLGTALVSGIRKGAALLPDVFNQGVLPALEGFFGSLGHIVENIDPVVGASLSSGIDSAFGLLSEGVVQLCGSVLSSLGGMLAGVPSIFMKTIITLIASVFMASDFKNIKNFLMRLLPDGAKPILHEAGGFFGKTVPRCLSAYLMIFLITFAELSVGFWILQVPKAPVIAVLVALLDILPVLGTGTVLIPWSIVLLIQGEVLRGVGTLLLYVVITVIRNMIEPKLVGRQIKLHPVLTFAGMLTGLHFFGMVGLFGVPLLLAFLRQLHEDGIIHISALDKKPTENQTD